MRNEVEVAVREVNTSYHEMLGRYHAMVAAGEQLHYLQRRWELLPGEDRAGGFLLEDLLDAQDRLVAEELEFARSQVEYTLSLSRLQRAIGTLLDREAIVW